MCDKSKSYTKIEMYESNSPSTAEDDDSETSDNADTSSSQETGLPPDYRETLLWLYDELEKMPMWADCSLWRVCSAEMVKKITYCFSYLHSHVKLKLLLRFFFIPKWKMNEWYNDLEEILEIALRDSEPWVSMLAEIMLQYPSTGNLAINVNKKCENKRIFANLINDIKDLLNKNVNLEFLPLECQYMNENTVENFLGETVKTPQKHFVLKHEHKSVTLKDSLLKKCAAIKSNGGKSTQITVPMKSRNMLRKMTDMTPLKGLPSHVLTDSFGTLNPNRPLPRSSLTPKEGGIKLLEINEQPSGGPNPKKRRLADIDSNDIKSGPDLPPDYASGLCVTNLAIPAYNSVGTQRMYPYCEMPNFVLQRDNFMGYGQLNVLPNKNSLSSLDSQNPRAVSVEYGYEIQNTMSKPPNVTLTKEQFSFAQQILKKASNLSKADKFLILCFIAGDRKNPRPHLGNIISIKLNEFQESNEFTSAIFETHVELNYITGECKQIKVQQIKNFSDNTNSNLSV